MAKYRSKLYDQVCTHVHALTQGHVLAIDPSSGSKNSKPGYAIFHAGVFQDGGVIQLTAGTELHKRLYYLGKTLREEFERPDILVTEYIPPVSQGFNANHMLSLQQAIGVTISSFDCPIIRVSPATWRRYIAEDYVKRDDNDALMLAYTAIREAQEAAGLPELDLDLIRQHLHTID